jgi:SnoaL-like domain
MDFSSFGSGLPRQVMEADDWVFGIVPLFTGLASSQNLMRVPLVSVDGNAVTVTMYVQAHQVYDPEDPASWYTVGGYYDDILVRDDSRWLLSACV